MKTAMNSLQLLAFQYPFSILQIITCHLPLENYHFPIIGYAILVEFHRILLVQLFPLAIETEVKERFQYIDLIIGWDNKLMDEYRLQPIETI